MTMTMTRPVVPTWKSGAAEKTWWQSLLVAELLLIQESLALNFEQNVQPE
jgi:hypothetical protein